MCAKQKESTRTMGTKRQYAVRMYESMNKVVALWAVLFWQQKKTHPEVQCCQDPQQKSNS